MGKLRFFPTTVKMASLVKKRGFNIGYQLCNTFFRNQRCLINSSSSQNSMPAVDEQEEKSWLRRLIPSAAERSRVSHSTALSHKDIIYELQFHHVKPEYMEQYLKEFEQFVTVCNDKKLGVELAGSWTVEVGDQDEAVHLWKYTGGYTGLGSVNSNYRNDEDFVSFRKSRNAMLRSRKNQLLLSFDFWGEMWPRTKPHIYELRTYTLKPGTMMEWGNHWSKGIAHRRDSDEAFGGFFSNIGNLNTVYHMWAYEDLEHRRVVRDNAWQRPGWDDCVYYTVPLIRRMTTRILVPTPISPTK